MASTPDVNVHTLRDEYESGTEWNLRFKFLEANKDSLPVDRLVCLSRCFINTTVYGCSYPPAIMEELRQRGQSLQDDIDKRHSGSNQSDGRLLQPVLARRHMSIQFVRSSDSLSTTPHPQPAGEPNQPVIGSSSSHPSQTSNHTQPGDINQHERHEQFPLSKNSNTSGQGNETQSFSNMDKKLQGNSNLACPAQHPDAQDSDPDLFIRKLRTLAQEVKAKPKKMNIVEKMRVAASIVQAYLTVKSQRGRATSNKGKFIGQVSIDNVSISSIHGTNARDAEANACNTALQKILMPHLRVVSVGSRSWELQASSDPFPSAPLQTHMAARPQSQRASISQNNIVLCGGLGQKRRRDHHRNMDEFVIIESLGCSADNAPVQTLHTSADFNHVQLEQDYLVNGENVRCILKINDEILADVNGVSKATAKSTASARALSYLKTVCWTVKVKQAVDSTTEISKDQLVSELDELSTKPLADDNVGNQLLRKMGWTGGGVGKDGGGIAEPVSVKSVINREGLGLSADKGITDDFTKKIKEVIENYAASSNQEDLVFSSELSVEERQVIHFHSKRLNLCSKSRGKGENRYLCVSRKRSASNLVNYLMSVGGETAKYLLVPPGHDGPAPGHDGPATH